MAIVLTSYDGSDDATGNINGESGTSEKRSQEFQIQSDATITSVEVKMRKSGSPVDNTVIKIEDDSAGVPSGNLVHANATVSRASSGLTTSFAFETFTFASSFSLVKDTVYHLVAERDGARNTTNLSQWSIDQSSPAYGYGTNERQASGTWGNLSYDHNFKVNGNVAVTYIPKIIFIN